MNRARVPWLDEDRARDTFADLEGRLDPAAPEECADVRILGYGELSAALTIDGLPGTVCKRMAGFASTAAADEYCALVDEYLAEVRASAVRVAETVPIPVPRPGRHPVVYLVQPLLDPATLGNSLLHSADDATLAAAIRLALGAVARVAHGTAARADGVEVAIDGQLSNWAYTDGSASTAPGGELPEPILIDVGTPFMRRNGRHVMQREYLLSPVPPGIRTYYGRRGLVEAYLDDYFVPRTVALDLLGNFHKEGASERLGLAASVVNEWLANADIPGPREPIHVTEVAEYYRKDADLLALYLRLRRMDRFIRTRVMRREYDFVLPGPVRR